MNNQNKINNSINMALICQLCQHTFSRSDNLKRHIASMHTIRSEDIANQSSNIKIIAPTSPPSNPARPFCLKRHMTVMHGQMYENRERESVATPLNATMSPDNVESSPFVHPFTMMICGPTSSGKTVWLQNLLSCKSIEPTIQRIVWCYGQWQSAYEHMSKTLSNIEFVRGIPDDLEQESYFDPSMNNLIVLDDLMTAAKNDCRVGDLFTKGAHHRSLSTIYVVQNLFAQGRASRDVALNCQYMVLFNSPVDRHQISVLARRIYPKNSDKMLKRYEEAMSQPYGHLVVDLKPTTPESMRLKVNVLPSKNEVIFGKPVPAIATDSAPESKTDTCQCVLPSKPAAIREERASGIISALPLNEESLDPYTNMPSCNDCGVMFGSLYDLQRHIKRWCPERANASLKRQRGDDDDDDDEDISSKKYKSDWLSTLGEEIEEEEDVDDEGQHRAFTRLLELAEEAIEDERKHKINKYVKEQGMTKDAANQKVKTKLQDAYMKAFIKKYGLVLRYIADFRHGRLHKQVMKSLYQYIDDGFDVDKSVRRALKRHRPDLEAVVEDRDDDGDTDGDVDTDDDGDDDDGDDDDDDDDENDASEDMEDSVDAE